MYGYDSEFQWWLDAVGGHAFSEDGIQWTYSGVAWGDPNTRIQGNIVNFTDGTAFRFTRRERPHLIFQVICRFRHLNSNIYSFEKIFFTQNFTKISDDIFGI